MLSNGDRSEGAFWKQDNKSIAFKLYIALIPQLVSNSERLQTVRLRCNNPWDRIHIELTGFEEQCKRECKEISCLWAAKLHQYTPTEDSYSYSSHFGSSYIQFTHFSKWGCGGCWQKNYSSSSSINTKKTIKSTQSLFLYSEDCYVVYINMHSMKLLVELPFLTQKVPKCKFWNFSLKYNLADSKKTQPFTWDSAKT